MPPRMRVNIADIAQRSISVGLFGLGIWGLWLTAAVFKSRRGDQQIEGVLGFSPESAERAKEEKRQQLLAKQARINPPPERPT